MKNGFRVMKSVLLITVIPESTNYGDLSVTCVNDYLSTGTAVTINVKVDKPGTYDNYCCICSNFSTQTILIYT